MIKLFRALGAVALALSLPLSVQAQMPQGCIGDDGFNVTWCQPVVNTNLPFIPPLTVDGDYCCLKDCALEASFPVRTSINHLPLNCDLALIQIVISPGAPGAPGYSGFLLGKLARTWVEPTPDPTGQMFERQVWRFLVNGDLTPTAGGSPCPIPPHADPSIADDIRVHFTGHIDYACDPNPLIPPTVDKFAINLNHEIGCISHNAFSASPLPLATGHHDRSYHLFGPSGFKCTPVPEPEGQTPWEAVRSTQFSNNYVCLGEAPIIDGVIGTRTADCLCLTGVVGPMLYKHQVVQGTIDCGPAGTNTYSSFPLFSPPVLPFRTGIVAHPLGLWTGAPEDFPGTRELTTYFGFMLFKDDCNPSDFPVKVVTGVGTLRPEGGVLFGGTDPGAFTPIFIDLEDMLLANSLRRRAGPVASPPYQGPENRRTSATGRLLRVGLAPLGHPARTSLKASMKTLTALSPVLLLVAAAFVAEPAQPASPGHEREVETWQVDRVHSAVIFRIQHAGAGPFYGRFNHIEGELKYDPEIPEEAEISFRIKADSADTNSEGRDRHVVGPDFLDAKQFPWISFTGTEVAETGENEFLVEGEFEMAGTSKPVSILVTKTGDGEFRGSQRRGFEATFTIDRSEFGMTYGLEQGVLGPDIKIIIGLEMVKQ
ncbi:MAG: YceI family protein [Planctomycetota bacterium]|jgi:polyisoprenoid-binding protein YceI